MDEVRANAFSLSTEYTALEAAGSQPNCSLNLAVATRLYSNVLPVSASPAIRATATRLADEFIVRAEVPGSTTGNCHYARLVQGGPARSFEHRVFPSADHGATVSPVWFSVRGPVVVILTPTV